MIERLFIARDVRSAIWMTIVWSLIIATVSDVATLLTYERFFPLFMNENRMQLRTCVFVLSLGISVPFVSLFVHFGTRLSAFNEQLREMALRDGLTGLLNRAALEDIVEARVAEPQTDEGDEDALILIDIDHFKKINDTHGHAAGDHALRTVAVSIVGNVFERDHVARVGGEEFAVLLLGAGPDGAINAAERIRTALEENKTYFEGKVIRVTVSIGGTLFPRGASFDTAFRSADFALYRAKRSGRNQCEFNGLPPVRPETLREAACGDIDAA